MAPTRRTRLGLKRRRDANRLAAPCVPSCPAVRLNGRDLGTVWKRLFAVDVTSALRPGHNALEVRVVNTRLNRLIADSGLPPAQRLTWTTNNPYHPGDPRQPSGLLGPVQLREAAPSKAN